MKDYYERMTPEQARAFKGGAYDQIRKNGAFLKNAPFFVLLNILFIFVALL